MATRAQTTDSKATAMTRVDPAPRPWPRPVLHAPYRVGAGEWPGYRHADPGLQIHLRPACPIWWPMNCTAACLPSGKLHFVGHSLGGILAKPLMRGLDEDRHGAASSRSAHPTQAARWPHVWKCWNRSSARSSGRAGTGRPIPEDRRSRNRSHRRKRRAERHMVTSPVWKERMTARSPCARAWGDPLRPNRRIKLPCRPFHDDVRSKRLSARQWRSSETGQVRPFVFRQDPSPTAHTTP